MPTRAAVSAHPKENVPSATRKPGNGRITSLGTGGMPKLSTAISPTSPGIPIVIITVVMMSTTDPISENVTVEPPACAVPLYESLGNVKEPPPGPERQTPFRVGTTSAEELFRAPPTEGARVEERTSDTAPTAILAYAAQPFTA